MILRILKSIVENIILFYAISLFCGYFILALISAFELRRKYFIGKVANYDAILSSPFAPSISVMAPAYNESLSIVENVKALLALYYPNYEIVIVNDGSNDDSLEKVIAAFDLELVPYVVDYKIPCAEIRGVYKSRKKSFNNLTIIYKVNGGKAD